MTEHEARKGNTPRFCKTGISVQTSLRGIANKAKEKPEYRFRNLYGMIDEELLRLAWRQLNKKAAAGVDQVTAQEYGKNLKANLDDLIDRLKRNGYRAKLVKRTLIPKGDGATRALGIPVLEDRLLQKAVSNSMKRSRLESRAERNATLSLTSPISLTSLIISGHFMPTCPRKSELQAIEIHYWHQELNHDKMYSKLEVLQTNA